MEMALHIGGWCFVCMGLSWWLTKRSIPLLEKFNLKDTPNQRSNHTRITPTGGGIAMVLLFLVFAFSAAITNPALPSSLPIILGLGTALALVSMLDDIFTIPSKVRLVIHLVVTSIAVNTTLPTGMFLGADWAWLEMLFIVFLWVWFLNLYNFMDGIDGITGMQTISICTGISLILILFPYDIFGLLIPLLLIAAVAGFLYWNWHPAHVFMGDVGSVFIGFLLGYLLLHLLYSGFYAAALLIPLYYLIDSGVTLLKRLKDRENIFEAHSRHFYQIAVRSGRTHSNVVLHILGCNIALIVLAVLATDLPHLAFIFIAAGLCMVGYVIKEFTTTHES